MQVLLYYIVRCIERGNHRSCQSPRPNHSYITLCVVLKEGTTEAVSRQDTSALILHCVAYSKRQPQKLSVANMQVLLYYIVRCVGRGNHRSCQSPTHKCSDITLCCVFREATTETVSRQYANVLILTLQKKQK